MSAVRDGFSTPEIRSNHLRAWYEELRFSSGTTWQRFGPAHINGIRGWIFSDEEIQAAAENDLLLHLDYEWGRSCSLRCSYCFRTDDVRDGKKPLSLDAWTDVIDQAKRLGLKSVKLLGQGELTEQKRFLEAMQRLADRSIETLLFTAGHVIGDDERCERIHGMTGEALARVLYELGLSIMVKVNSFDPARQDAIVGSSGYTGKRNLALSRLLEAGFADHNPTRLGLEVAMMGGDKDELEDIYNLKSLLNVYIDLDPFMPCGRTRDDEILTSELSYDDKLDLYSRVYTNNVRYGVPFRGISPYAGGQVCSQLGYGLYVNLYGNVYPCPGSHEDLGSVSEESLKSIFMRSATRRRFLGSRDHGCPYREEAGILRPEWEERVRETIAPLVADSELFQLRVD